MGMHKEKCCAQRVQGSLNSFFVYKSFYSLGLKRKKKVPFTPCALKRLHHFFSHSNNSAETAVLHRGQEAINCIPKNVFHSVIIY